MKAEEQTLLNETLAKVYKLDQEQLATLYNEAGDLTDLAALVDADQKRMAKLTTEKTSQYNRGIKEGAGKIEKELKEKYGLESDLIGVDLIEQLVLREVESVKTEGAKDISKHPDYIKLQSEVDKKLKERDREWEKKLTDRENEFNREQVFVRVKDKALTSLESRKPILPMDAKKAQTWKDTFVNDLRSYNYQLSEDGSIIVLDKEGNAIKDSHGYIVTFDEFEKQIADKYFEYPASTSRSSSGNSNTSSSSNGNVGEPKTKAECLAKLKEPKITPEDRKKYTDLMDKLPT